MIYSVFDYDRQAYDYYEGPGPSGTHAGAPPIRSHKPLGATLEQSAWIVPMAARKVGSGELPKGRIAVLAGDSLGDTPAPSSGKLAIGAVIAYAAWRFLR